MRRAATFGPVGILVETVAWCAVLTGVWMLTVAPPDAPDAWLAAAAGLPCALVSVLARYAMGDRWRPGRETLRWLVLVPVAAVTDTARVLTVPLRSARSAVGRGDLVQVPLPAGGGVARVRTRRAEATLAVCATPATIVVDTRRDEEALVVHRMVEGRPSVTAAVRG